MVPPPMSPSPKRPPPLSPPPPRSPPPPNRPNPPSLPPLFCHPIYGRGDCSENNFCARADGRGVCRNGRCICSAGFGGHGCELEARCHFWDASLVRWSDHGIHTLHAASSENGPSAVVRCAVDRFPTAPTEYAAIWSSAAIPAAPPSAPPFVASSFALTVLGMDSNPVFESVVWILLLDILTLLLAWKLAAVTRHPAKGIIGWWPIFADGGRFGAPLPKPPSAPPLPPLEGIQERLRPRGPIAKLGTVLALRNRVQPTPAPSAEAAPPPPGGIQERLRFPSKKTLKSAVPSQTTTATARTTALATQHASRPEPELKPEPDADLLAAEAALATAAAAAAAAEAAALALERAAANEQAENERKAAEELAAAEAAAVASEAEANAATEAALEAEVAQEAAAQEADTAEAAANEAASAARRRFGAVMQSAAIANLLQAQASVATEKRLAVERARQEADKKAVVAEAALERHREAAGAAARAKLKARTKTAAISTHLQSKALEAAEARAVAEAAALALATAQAELARKRAAAASAGRAKLGVGVKVGTFAYALQIKGQAAAEARAVAEAIAALEEKAAAEEAARVAESAAAGRRQLGAFTQLKSFGSQLKSKAEEAAEAQARRVAEELAASEAAAAAAAAEEERRAASAAAGVLQLGAATKVKAFGAKLKANAEETLRVREAEAAAAAEAARIAAEVAAAAEAALASAKSKIGAATSSISLLRMVKVKSDAAAVARAEQAEREAEAKRKEEAAAAARAAAAEEAAEAEKVRRQEAARTKLGSSIKTVGRSNWIASILEENVDEAVELRAEAALFAAQAAAAEAAEAVAAAEQAEQALASAKLKVGAVGQSVSVMKMLQEKADAAAAARVAAEAAAREAAEAEAEAEAAAAEEAAETERVRRQEATRALARAKLGSSIKAVGRSASIANMFEENADDAIERRAEAALAAAEAAAEEARTAAEAAAAAEAALASAKSKLGAGVQSVTVMKFLQTKADTAAELRAVAEAASEAETIAAAEAAEAETARRVEAAKSAKAKLSSTMRASSVARLLKSEAEASAEAQATEAAAAVDAAAAEARALLEVAVAAEEAAEVAIRRFGTATNSVSVMKLLQSKADAAREARQAAEAAAAAEHSAVQQAAAAEAARRKMAAAGRAKVSLVSRAGMIGNMLKKKGQAAADAREAAEVAKAAEEAAAAEAEAMAAGAAAAAAAAAEAVLAAAAVREKASAAARLRFAASSKTMSIANMMKAGGRRVADARAAAEEEQAAKVATEAAEAAEAASVEAARAAAEAALRHQALAAEMAEKAAAVAAANEEKALVEAAEKAIEIEVAVRGDTADDLEAAAAVAEEAAAVEAAAAEAAAAAAAEKAAAEKAAAEEKINWKEKDEKAVLEEMRERDEQRIARRAEAKAAENEAVQAALTAAAERRAAKAAAQAEAKAEEARRIRAIVAAKQGGQLWASQAGAHARSTDKAAEQEAVAEKAAAEKAAVEKAKEEEQAAAKKTLPSSPTSPKPPPTSPGSPANPRVFLAQERLSGRPVSAKHKTSVHFGEGIDKSDAGLEAAFAKIDIDKSGKIDADEMKGYILSTYENGLDDKTIDEMMMAADIDKDGEVNLAEFMVIMRAGPSGGFTFASANGQPLRLRVGPPEPRIAQMAAVRLRTLNALGTSSVGESPGQLGWGSSVSRGVVTLSDLAAEPDGGSTRPQTALTATGISFTLGASRPSTAVEETPHAARNAAAALRRAELRQRSHAAVNDPSLEALVAPAPAVCNSSGRRKSADSFASCAASVGSNGQMDYTATDVSGFPEQSSRRASQDDLPQMYDTFTTAGQFPSRPTTSGSLGMVSEIGDSLPTTTALASTGAVSGMVAEARIRRPRRFDISSGVRAAFSFESSPEIASRLPPRARGLAPEANEMGGARPGTADSKGELAAGMVAEERLRRRPGSTRPAASALRPVRALTGDINRATGDVRRAAERPLSQGNVLGQSQIPQERVRWVGGGERNSERLSSRTPLSQLLASGIANTIGALSLSGYMRPSTAPGVLPSTSEETILAAPGEAAATAAGPAASQQQPSLMVVSEDGLESFTLPASFAPPTRANAPPPPAPSTLLGLPYVLSPPPSPPARVMPSRPGSGSTSRPGSGGSRSRMEEEALAALHQCSPSTATLLPALLTALRESSSTRAFVFEEDQAAALRQLTQLVSESSDQEAIALCEYLRAAGGVQLIAGLLGSHVPSTHQMAIALVGNLASVAVDPNAEKTKVLLKTAGAFGLLLPHIFSEEQTTLVSALSAVQILCTEIAYVEQLQQAGGLERLQAILQLNDPQLEPFARGCLVNVTQARAANQGTFGYAMGVLSNVLGGGSAAQVLPPARASAPTAAPAPSELRAMKAELEVLEAQGEALGKLEDDELEDDLDDEDEDEGINELWDPEGVHAAKLMALAEKGVRTGRFIKKVRHKGRDRDVSALKVQACYRGHLARRTVLPKALAYPSAPPPRKGAIVCKAPELTTPDKEAWRAWPEVKLEISTKAGERLGWDLAAATTGGVEVRTNTIGVNAGSRLLSINGQDVRRSAPQEVAVMLLEADGLVELHFAIATPSRWSTFKGSILTWLSSSGSPSPVLPATGSRQSGDTGSRSKWAGGLGTLTNKARRPVKVTELAWDDRSAREIVLGWLREHTLYCAVASFLFGDGPKMPTGAQACQLLWTTALGLLYIVCMQLRYSWLAGDRVHALTTNGASTRERAPFVTAVAFMSTIILYPCLLAGRGLFMMVNRQQLVYNQAHGLTRIATDTKAALSSAMAGAIALHKSLDLDGDGKVTAAELYMAAKAKARERTARLKKMRDDLRASLDTDGDGKVSWSEMRAGMRRLRREMAAQTKSAFQERRERLRTMRAELRASLDTDGDGKVSAAEFAAGMRRLRKEAAARARERAKQMGANPLFSTTLAFASVWGIAFFLMLALAVGSVSAAASMDERVVREDVISAWWLAMALQWLLIEPIVVAVLAGYNLLCKRLSTFEGPDIAALNLKITHRM